MHKIINGYCTRAAIWETLSFSSLTSIVNCYKVAQECTQEVLLIIMTIKHFRPSHEKFYCYPCYLICCGVRFVSKLSIDRYVVYGVLQSISLDGSIDARPSIYNQNQESSPTQLETSRWSSTLRDGSWYTRSVFY